MLRHITEKEILDKFNSGSVQSKFLIVVSVNNEILYWKDAYYEVEKNSIADTFINGLWSFNPGTELTLRIYDLHNKETLSSYKLDFLQSGMQIITEYRKS